MVMLAVLYCNAARPASRCGSEEAPESQLRRLTMFLATILRAVMHVVNAIGEANRRKAERELALMIRRNGSKFTDSLERGMERRVHA